MYAPRSETESETICALAEWNERDDKFRPRFAYQMCEFCLCGTRIAEGNLVAFDEGNRHIAWSELGTHKPNSAKISLQMSR